MMRIMIFLLQASGAPVAGPADLSATPPRRIDLQALPATCADDVSKIAADEVVVCGRPDTSERYRMRPLDPRIESPKRAEVRLPGGMKGAAEVERADIGGNVSNRLMFRLKLPF